MVSKVGVVGRRAPLQRGTSPLTSCHWFLSLKKIKWIMVSLEGKKKKKKKHLDSSPSSQLLNTPSWFIFSPLFILFKKFPCQKSVIPFLQTLLFCMSNMQHSRKEALSTRRLWRQGGQRCLSLVCTPLAPRSWLHLAAGFLMSSGVSLPTWRKCFGWRPYKENKHIGGWSCTRVELYLIYKARSSGPIVYLSSK